MIQELSGRGANLDQLTPELREQYYHLIPEEITPQEYYRLESDFENIRDFGGRYLLYVGTKLYLLLY